MSVSVTFFDVTGFFQAIADPSVSGVLNQPIVQPINALVTFTRGWPKDKPSTSRTTSSAPPERRANRHPDRIERTRADGWRLDTGRCWATGVGHLAS